MNWKGQEKQMKRTRETDYFSEKD